jgi:hypothetical protein
MSYRFLIALVAALVTWIVTQTYGYSYFGPGRPFDVYPLRDQSIAYSAIVGIVCFLILSAITRPWRRK